MKFIDKLAFLACIFVTCISPAQALEQTPFSIFEDQSNEQEIPQRYISKWVLDRDATNERIAKELSQNRHVTRLVTHLLELNSALTFEITSNQLIMSTEENKAVYDLALLQNIEHESHFVIKANHFEEHLTIKRLEENSIQIISGQLRGSRYFVWRRL